MVQAEEKKKRIQTQIKPEINFCAIFATWDRNSRSVWNQTPDVLRCWIIIYRVFSSTLRPALIFPLQSFKAKHLKSENDAYKTDYSKSRTTTKTI